MDVVFWSFSVISGGLVINRYYIFGCLFIFFKMFSGKTDYQSLMVGQFEDYGRHLMRSMCLCIMASRLTAPVSWL